MQDRRLPCVVSMVTGESLNASWWSHPKAQSVFHTLSQLADHPDVVSTKLISGKVTFIHRKLWPDLLAVASSGEGWQTRGLSNPAKKLWKGVKTNGSLEASGPAVKELEKRLLVHSREVHTESGAHRLIVELWSLWAARAKCEATTSVRESCMALERAAGGIGAAVSALPWGHTKMMLE